jgi:hypothetical protein
VKNNKNDNAALPAGGKILLRTLTITAVAALAALIFYLVSNAPATDPAAFTIEDGVLSAYSGDGASVEIPEGVTVVAERAFMNHTEIEKVTFPRSLTTLKSGAFYGCTALAEIKFSDALNFIGDAAFGECRALTELTIPASVGYIHSEAFYDTSALAAVHVEEGSETYVSQNGVLYNDDFTQLICYPAARPGESFTVPDSVEAIAMGAFAFNKNLKSVDLAQVQAIGERAFQQCSSLTSAAIPATVGTIYEGAFADCSSLSSLTLADGVKVLQDEAFVGCSSLESVVIPASVTEVGRFAFADCPSLTEIHFPDALIGIYDTTFLNDENLTIYAPEGSPTQSYAEEFGIDFVAE